jgi:hypothetical protein
MILLLDGWPLTSRAFSSVHFLLVSLITSIHSRANYVQTGEGYIDRLAQNEAISQRILCEANAQLPIIISARILNNVARVTDIKCVLEKCTDPRLKISWN